MVTRRQERMGRAIRDAVSDAVANHLNDPRLEGFVSVTRVEVAADLHTADVYFSIFGGDQAVQSKTFAAITHARSRIQVLLSQKVQSKFCPVLQFYMDQEIKKTLEIMKLIDKAASEFREKDSSGRPPEELPE